MATLFEKIGYVYSQYLKDRDEDAIKTIDTAVGSSMCNEEDFCTLVGKMLVEGVSRTKRKDFVSAIIQDKKVENQPAIRVRKRIFIERIGDTYHLYGKNPEAYHRFDEKTRSVDWVVDTIERMETGMTRPGTIEFCVQELLKLASDDPNIDADSILYNMGKAVIIASMDHYKLKQQEAPRLRNFKKFLVYNNIVRKLQQLLE